MALPQRWIDTGAAALTGRADGPPLDPPTRLVAGVDALSERLGVDGVGMLAARARIAGLSRRGDISCGGATRLLRCADGWLAVALPRADDVTMVPAWLRLEFDLTDCDLWPRVTDELRDRPRAELVDWARVLGLAVAALPDPGSLSPAAVGTTRVGIHSHREVADLTVVDLSSLWAGPLCSRLLADHGARVIKVESSARPDGIRAGPARFDALLNHGKERVELDFASDAGIAELRRLIADADIVIEASRPRALQQLGIDAGAVPDGPGPSVWVSITGYGRSRDGIAFGDDAAAAGGLVVFDADGPCFCLDAVADPLTGMVAAAATLDAIANGDAVLLDVAMAGVAARFADR